MTVIGLVTSLPAPLEAKTSGIVPWGMFQAKANNENSPGLPPGIGHGAIRLVADAHTRRRVSASDIEGRCVCHADVEVVLLGVDADRRGLRHDRHIPLDASGLVQQIVRGRLDDQLGLAVFELWRCLDAGGEAPHCFLCLRGLFHLPDWIACTVLLHGGGDTTDAAWIGDMHHDRSGLADDAHRRWQLDRRCGGTAHQHGDGNKDEERKDKKQDFAHNSF